MRRRCCDADLVITGEGRLDSQSCSVCLTQSCALALRLLLNPWGLRRRCCDADLV
ncbi:hypothetical protein, partial [Cronobacter sakazakii]|uniref:hypothetical protein n=1 Tax=Cronobacter sakazakii TaxID=28141 RepID=UPI00387B0EE7